MNLYADASALLKLLLREAGSESMATATEGSSVICASLGYLELRAGLARAWRQRRMTSEVFEGHVLAVQQLWRSVTSIPVDEDLVERAADDAERYGLRAYDAVHLAALQVAGPPGTITFACWDHDLREAAGRIGYELLPEAA